VTAKKPGKSGVTLAELKEKVRRTEANVLRTAETYAKALQDGIDRGDFAVDDRDLTFLLRVELMRYARSKLKAAKRRRGR